MDYNQAQEPTRPRILLGYHDSSLEQPLNDLQYGKAVNQGISYLTSPITNSHFHQRITELVKNHLQSLKEINSSATADLTAAIPDPIIPPLTTKDTSLFPSFSVSTYNAYTSSWIDLASPDPVIANISRQVLNLELAYATWCGVRSIVIHGPRQDSARGNANKGLAQYARAIREALTVASRQNITIHMPMYREPGLDDSSPSLTETVHGTEAASKKSSEIALFSVWDSWHFVRTFCEYNPRLFVGDPGDALSKNEFPTLADSVQKADQRKPAAGSSYISYMQWLESQQNPYSNLENSTFISFQDWLQSPLQPLSDNLESATYEVFEGDPVKYNQYEAALVEALTEWKALNKPTSSKSGAVVVAVAARKSGGVIGGGGGSMAGAAGVNDHNYRQCHLTFVARNKGVVHGLGGYFESTLYQKQIGEPTKIEISILPEQIDKKSKDMTSWFPIYFPLTKPIDFPADSEIEVFMWRQTNDTKVWSLASVFVG
ncbi:Protein arginine N-methyltransferase skb1 [Ceratocystis platani]|uniref:Protein arginine N-methyltransferase skb1 n=1 Tax=Ceratocystis fimbriata f. sp. platani TaxID=88771 RepID=A0A0F8BM24_CERFI|nr:Protein arginine N-methyltransferase skb1 [Ceratocystis platani]